MFITWKITSLGKNVEMPHSCTQTLLSFPMENQRLWLETNESYLIGSKIPNNLSVWNVHIIRVHLDSGTSSIVCNQSLRFSVSKLRGIWIRECEMFNKVTHMFLTISISQLKPCEK